MIPSSARIAVYDAPNGPFVLREYPLRPPAAGEVLVRIAMSTICRSDIHSWQGHRPNPCPGVLGHEIVGRIAALGTGIDRDMRGEPLAVGDRITWSEYFIPGPNYCSEVLDLPQKSPGVDKYGHMAATTPPHHHGGFGEYCYILPQSWILRLPDVLSDAEATPINCGVATMIAVTEAAEIRIGQTVVIQGLGLLGLYGAAIAKARGAGRVIGIDGVAERRALGARFGVDLALDPTGVEPAELARQVCALCRPLGADVVLEVCGDPAVINAGIAMLRVGGHYVLGGVVNPGAMVTLDANLLLRKMLTLRGVHNYHPRHLVEALDFVVAQRQRFPFAELVDGIYTLDRVNTAMADAAARRVLRAAIAP
jgi:putative phosphonate catabolism associated alcohol dehydrogenase